MILPHPDITPTQKRAEHVPGDDARTSGHLAHVLLHARPAAALSLFLSRSPAIVHCESAGNFHKFRHTASKWLPVQRSDIVDNRHVARGRIQYRIRAAKPSPCFLRLRYPLQPPLGPGAPLSPSSTHLPPPSGIVPRIVPKVFGEPA